MKLISTAVLSYLVIGVVFCDFVYQFSNTSNLELEFVLEQSTAQVEFIFENEILKANQLILYFDSVWSLDAKRSFTQVIKPLFEFTTLHDIPLYRYEYSEWNPKSQIVKQWYENESDYNTASGDEFNFYNISQYRSVLFMLQQGKIKYQSLNAYFTGIDAIINNATQIYQLRKEEL